jgi:predicted nucleic-acid-binding protein
MTADTNLLVRTIMRDDPAQADLALNALAMADLVAITLPTLCEYVWVLSRGYKISRPAIAATIRHMLAASNVVTNQPGVDAGLAALDAGGDFADGVIAFEGRRLGADHFLSFDRKAVAMMTMRGINARLLA